jgi:hypothetical protein
MQPPTVPGPIVAVERDPIWHTVLGIFAIVFGAGGVLQGLWGMLTPVLMSFFEDFVPEDQHNPIAFMDEMGVFMVAISSIIFLLAVLLLVAGIFLVRRSRIAVPLCVLWAALKMCAVVANTVFTYFMQQAQFDAMANDPNMQQAPAVMGGIMQGVAIGTAVLTLLWGWAMPVFVLIWFRRRKIREQIAGWRG